MRPAMKEWYIATYGQERYDKYWRFMETLDERRVYDPKKYVYGYRAYHDAESFAWIIINELMRAWPEGHEELLSPTAEAHIASFLKHSFRLGSDDRQAWSFISITFWQQILHPRLAFLALMACRLLHYFGTEWLLWPELPEDHGHEVIKILIMEALEDMKSDPIPLKQLLRTPQRGKGPQ